MTNIAARATPCGEAPDIEQRVALAMIARSPIERLMSFKKERGWDNHFWSAEMGSESADPGQELEYPSR